MYLILHEWKLFRGFLHIHHIFNDAQFRNLFINNELNMSRSKRRMTKTKRFLGNGISIKERCTHSINSGSGFKQKWNKDLYSDWLRHTWCAHRPYSGTSIIVMLRLTGNAKLASTIDNHLRSSNTIETDWRILKKKNNNLPEKIRNIRGFHNVFYVQYNLLNVDWYLRTFLHSTHFDRLSKLLRKRYYSFSHFFSLGIRNVENININKNRWRAQMLHIRNDTWARKWRCW